jgi:hypothetical protein
MELDPPLAALSELPPDTFNILSSTFDEDMFAIPIEATLLVTPSLCEQLPSPTFNLALDAVSIPAETFTPPLIHLPIDQVVEPSLTAPLSFSKHAFTIPIDSPPPPSPQLATCFPINIVRKPTADIFAEDGSSMPTVMPLPYRDLPVSPPTTGLFHKDAFDMPTMTTPPDVEFSASPLGSQLFAEDAFIMPGGTTPLDVELEGSTAATWLVAEDAFTMPSVTTPPDVELEGTLLASPPITKGPLGHMELLPLRAAAFSIPTGVTSPVGVDHPLESLHFAADTFSMPINNVLPSQLLEFNEDVFSFPTTTDVVFQEDVPVSPSICTSPHGEPWHPPFSLFPDTFP